MDKKTSESKQRTVRQYLDKHYSPLNEFNWVANSLAELAVEGKIALEELEKFSEGLMDHQPKEDFMSPLFRVSRKIKPDAGTVLDKIIEGKVTFDETKTLPTQSIPSELSKKYFIISEEICSLDLSDIKQVQKLQKLWSFMFGDGEESKQILEDFDDTMDFE